MTEHMTEARLDSEIRAFLAWHSDDIAGAPTAIEMTVRVRERVRPGGFAPLTGNQQRLVLALLLTALLALLISTAAYVGWFLPSPLGTVQNGWIAISTQPGYRQTFGTDLASGGDLYLMREGLSEPRMIVDRGAAMNHNVCPQFSPDGSLLAYGELAGGTAAIVVLIVTADGAVDEWRRFPLPGPSALAPCPRWIRGGTHIAYLDGVRWDADGQLESPGTAVRVVDLDGAFAEPTSEDPSVEDLRQSGTFDPLESPDGVGPLLSRDGHLGAVCGDSGLLIGPHDGSADRLVPTYACGYSLAAWSPDGSIVATLADVDGRHAAMTLVPVVGPSDEQYIQRIPVNGARQWPGRGDVSWQEVHP